MRTGLYTTGRRLQGFLDTMQSAGIEADPTLIVDGHYDGERAYAESDAADDAVRPAEAGNPCR